MCVPIRRRLLTKNAACTVLVLMSGLVSSCSDSRQRAIEEICPLKLVGSGNQNAYEEFRNANKSARNNNYEKAISELTRSLDADPNFGCAYFNRANSKVELGLYQQAIDDYTRTIVFDQGFADAYIGRGLAYLRRGDYKSAIDDQTTAIKLDERAALAWSNRAYARLQEGSLSEARNDFSQAIQLMPEEPKYLFQRAEVSIKLKQRGLACEDYRKAYTLESGTKNKKTLLKRIDINCGS